MPKDVARLTAADFEPLNGADFTVAAPNGELVLKLANVDRLGAAVREGGAFSLTLVSAPGPFLPQAVYPVAHPELGTLELFVVPLGPKDGANRYQVIFT
jgi:hypothetical protein